MGEPADMKEHPLLFTGPMVRALLDGRKTQTRRLMNPQPVVDRLLSKRFGHDVLVWRPTKADCPCSVWNAELPVMETGAAGIVRYAPIAVGDLIWVRETFDWVAGSTQTAGESPKRFDKVLYRASGDEKVSAKWTPSIHMPKWATRIWLRVTEVRAQRVQEISEEDAVAEGCFGHYSPAYVSNGEIVGPDERTPYHEFRDNWRDMHGLDSWSRNDFVWVYSFERIEK